MLLVIDVGNTNTVLGVFAPDAQSHALAQPGTILATNTSRNWRVATSRTSTVDEYGVVRICFRWRVSSPRAFAARRRLGRSSPRSGSAPGLRALLQFPSALYRTGREDGNAESHYDNPASGRRPNVNAVAAFESYGGPLCHR